MQARKKILTVVGTRPEIVKLACVIPELDQHTDHVLVHTGQNYDYELNEVFFRDLGIRKPDFFLDAAGGTAAKTIARVIERIDELYLTQKPDALLIYGDTNSCLSAIPAKRRHIPVFHMEAGNRCFDERVPEELNRRIVDHISDLNMTITEHARRYLVAEGLRADRIVRIGSSMPEIIQKHRDSIARSTVLETLHLKRGEFIVLSAHREENVDFPSELSLLVASINALCEEFGKRIVFSIHPRTRNRLESSNAKLHDLVSGMPPLGFLDYMKLQSQAFCVVSDSGTITEESAIEGFPAVTIRRTHERPEGMDNGVVVLTGLEPGSVVESVRVVTEHHREGFRPRCPSDYGPTDVSKKVLRLILSYIDHINYYTWRKP